MQAVSNLIIIVTICAILRGILAIITPESSMKKITEVTTNVVIMSAILSEILNLLKNWIG